MISVQEAEALIMKNCVRFETEQVGIYQAHGRILRESIIADRDFPPYDRIAMDGIAFNYDHYENGTRAFKIAGIAAAGSAQTSLFIADHCLEVMTGAMLPNGLDTVVPYEWLNLTNENAVIHEEKVVRHQNIHHRGGDKKVGELLLEEDIRISPAEIAICASVGKSQLLVSRSPKTLILSSGNELTEIDSTPQPHQIRKSNVHAISAFLDYFAIQSDTSHLNDDLEEITRFLKKSLSIYELIIISGGVSKGKFDFFPVALEKIGVKKVFHKIAQRPGKPFWFGKHPKGSTVFAFPGNPVSSFLCMQRYLKLWLETGLYSKPNPLTYAVLAEDIHFKPELTFFPEVSIRCTEQGILSAMPLNGNGSGDLNKLSKANGFIELPPQKSVFKAGEIYPVFLYRPLI